MEVFSADSAQNLIKPERSLNSTDFCSRHHGDQPAKGTSPSPEKTSCDTEGITGEKLAVHGRLQVPHPYSGTPGLELLWLASTTNVGQLANCQCLYVDLRRAAQTWTLPASHKAGVKSPCLDKDGSPVDGWTARWMLEHSDVVLSTEKHSRAYRFETLSSISLWKHLPYSWLFYPFLSGIALGLFPLTNTTNPK